MKERETVDRLITLALDPGASENESRNAALAAVKLIDEHDMLDQKIIEGKKRTTISIMVEFKAVLEKIQSADFDGAISVIESLKRRAERMSADRINNMRADMDAKPTWTEQTTHHARRASYISECAYCHETILMWTWVVNPFRDSIHMHLRCFREGKNERRGSSHK